jgi:uncharacterized protein involved in exopolysaccharide biosynthesis
MLASDDDQEGGGADLFDRERAWENLGFLLGAVRRRRGLVAALILAIMSLVIASLAVLPRTYRVEARLLAQRNVALAPRAEGPDAAPTRGAVELIRSRTSLLALIQATDLLHHWEAHRAPALRALDTVRRLVAHEEDEETRMDGMIEHLERKLSVSVNEGAVIIAIEWTDAEMARRLVDVAQHNFLDVRRAQEITALSDSLAVLRGRADGLRKNIDDAVVALDELRAKRGGPRAPGTGATTGTPDARRPGELRPDGEQLQAAIAAKQRALDDLEAFRRHRVSELQAHLAELRAAYTEQHPAIGDLQQSIASLSGPSPQIKALRDELASLRGKERRGRPEMSGPPLLAFGPAAGQSRSEILILDEGLREDRDPATVYARGRLRDAMDKFAANREKVEAAQIDLETAEVAFKYRYNLITPAKLPQRPEKPSVPLTLLAALLAASLGAVLTAVVADLRAGRIEERWQIERLLEQPLLAEIEAPWRSDA